MACLRVCVSTVIRKLYMCMCSRLMLVMCECVCDRVGMWEEKKSHLTV